jgi:hypothetical protein
MSGKRVLTDAEFIELWNSSESIAKFCETSTIDRRNVLKRRRNLEMKYKIQLPVKSQVQRYEHLQTAHRHTHRYELGIENGTVLVFSDAHFWPGIRSTAFKGLLWAIDALQPKAIICNGDAFDGAAISRFPRIGWDSKPSVLQELHACEACLGEIEEAAQKTKKKIKLIWPLGNHDARFENRLAQNAGEFEGVTGFHLKDHFPEWIPCWSTWLTENVVVKHRYKGGIHATHNNTVGSGKSIVTGHLHSLKVTPYSDYNGTRYGVDTGTLADTDGPQFVDYLEDSPTNWRSGFAVLTFKDGQLLYPEVVQKFSEGHIQFRGQVINVSKL